MRSFSALTLALVCGLTTARGEWRVVQLSSERSSVVEHRVLEADGGGAKATLQFAVFAGKSAVLRVIDNADGNADLATAMRQHNCLAGVNGGYFDPQFAPIGLRISGGLTSSPLVRAHLLTGIFFSSGGRFEIARIAGFNARRNVDAAVECGPMLVEAGAAVATLNRTRTARRTFAAIMKDGNAALGFCSDVTLAELGTILSRSNVTRALNLDGGSSSAFWFKRADGSVFEIGELKAVRDFLGVAPR